MRMYDTTALWLALPAGTLIVTLLPDRALTLMPSEAIAPLWNDATPA